MKFSGQHGAVCVATLLALITARAQALKLPARHSSAPRGVAIVQAVQELPLAQREERIVAEILQGNVPEFWRHFVPVRLTNSLPDRTNVVVISVAPDYLAVGSNDDYFLAPLTPMAAERVAQILECSLPTLPIVDAIHASAPLKLVPAPIPPSAAMTRVAVMAEHNAMVRTQRWEHLERFPLGTLVAGHKKDVVQTPALKAAPGKVAIYGWHYPDGRPIQPLYLGHTNLWVDYSHGIRLVSATAQVDGTNVSLPKILEDPSFGALLTNASPSRFIEKVAEVFGERNEQFRLEPRVEVLINREGSSPDAPSAPAEIASATRNRPLHLIVYALPNGNSLAQTIGRSTRPGEDWHYNIQHIGAQLRFLRNAVKGTEYAAAYVKADENSWPAWRGKHPNNGPLITNLLEKIRLKLGRKPDAISLNCHSGGGSFLFGFIEGVAEIPDEVERIAFLDATYGFNPASTQAAKLIRWLERPSPHFLSVIAYEDFKGLINGKTFVSEQGGTWRRSHLLLKELQKHFAFNETKAGLWEEASGLDGRIRFRLRENPEQAVWHTILVERNGFIDSMLAGTPREGKGYEFFGPRAYEQWIATE